jgi:predicted small secreted protein
MKRRKRKKGTFAMALAIAVAAMAAVLVQGCNTIEGVGADVSAAGQGLADAAHNNNPDHK